MTLYSDAIPRAEEYARRRHLSIEKQLGSGIQGVVFSTSEGTAIKSFIHIEHYQRERDIYLRLKEERVENRLNSGSDAHFSTACQQTVNHAPQQIA